jgi:hypothetical protein
MRDSMAESRSTMSRIERLEGAFLQITDLLVLQGERLDAQREEMTSLRGELRTEMRTLRDTLTDRLDAVTDRLDRLIAVTTKDRTFNVERLATIEMRLTRLEERVGV